MSAELLVVVPVLNRPRRARSVYESIVAATRAPVRVLFVCSKGDRGEIRTCRSIAGADVLVAPWKAGPGDWARKINLAYRSSSEPYLFLGADDLRFEDGWDVPALNLARLGYGVVGTQDLGNPAVLKGNHSTHSLVSRRYVDEHGTIDAPELVLHEGYDHQFCDNELVETAKARDEWAFAGDSIVEHLHPYFRKSAIDETYRKALRATKYDRTLFLARRSLWEAACVHHRVSAG